MLWIVITVPTSLAGRIAQIGRGKTRLPVMGVQHLRAPAVGQPLARDLAAAQDRAAKRSGLSGNRRRGASP
jgi:hypothetical protein